MLSSCSVNLYLAVHISGGEQGGKGLEKTLSPKHLSAVLGPPDICDRGSWRCGAENNPWPTGRVTPCIHTG